MAEANAAPRARDYRGWFLAEAMTFPECRLVAGVWVSVAVAVAILTALYGRYPLWQTFGVMALGLVAWSPVEYALHRHFMHWRGRNPSVAAFIDKLLPHKGHHRMPDGPRGTVWRQQHYPFAMIATFFLVTTPLGPVEFGANFFAGIGLGYMLYEIVHHAVHKCRMAGPVGRALEARHMFHHFNDDRKNFGLTSGLWDRVFGTAAR